jgi:purine-binding chemotaxis protein CheW
MIKGLILAMNGWEPNLFIDNGGDLMERQGNTYLTFCLDKEVYGIPIKKVKEIIGMQELTHIPKMKGYIKGVINLRGKIIPIMDLRLKFGIDERSYTDRTCIIVIEINPNGNRCWSGIVVDTVNEVTYIQKDEIEDPGYDTGTEGGFLTGLGKLKDKVVLILDIGKIFSREELTLYQA